MINEIKDDVQTRMDKAIESLRYDLATIRTGKANPALVENISVIYYDTPTPISQLAGISVPEARMILIQPWDKTVLKEIEKAILKSDLGITPNNDGTVIRLPLPQLTKETRVDLVKTVKKKGEEAKVRVRNIRRDANDAIKKLEKSKEIAEDAAVSAQDEIQKITDGFVADIDVVITNKESEIMEI